MYISTQYGVAKFDCSHVFIIGLVSGTKFTPQNSEDKVTLHLSELNFILQNPLLLCAHLHAQVDL